MTVLNDNVDTDKIFKRLLEEHKTVVIQIICWICQRELTIVKILKINQELSKDYK